MTREVWPARRPWGLITTVVLLTGVVGCSSDGVASMAKEPAGQGAQAALQLVPPSARTTRISLQGTTLDGARLSPGDLVGKVVVINTWGSWCAPCNREAPQLVAAHRELADRGVAFVGIDVREGPAAGRAFIRKFGISYPSLAWDGGRVLLQLQGEAPGTPTTIVLDSQGRLAARALAGVDAKTLESIVQDVLDE